MVRPCVDVSAFDRAVTGAMLGGTRSTGTVVACIMPGRTRNPTVTAAMLCSTWAAKAVAAVVVGGSCAGAAMACRQVHVFGCTRRMVGDRMWRYLMPILMMRDECHVVAGR
jgi:hypothetical protein